MKEEDFAQTARSIALGLITFWYSEPPTVKPN